MKSRRVLSLCSAIALTLAGVVSGPGAAHAETRECRTNVKSFNLPNKPDVKVNITLCVVRSGGLVQARADLSWTGNLGFIGGTRFNDFSLKLNLENAARLHAEASRWVQQHE